MGCCVCAILFVGALLAAYKLFIKLTTGWCWSQRCLVGKTAIVTGANTGIGYETAIDFAKRGAKVIIASRNEDYAREARDQIIKETDNPNVSYKLLDLSSLKSVRKFAEEINQSESRLDILVNNAAGGTGDIKTEDGLLLGMQTNYYGPFLLTYLLLDLLKKTQSSRIVNVSSNLAASGVLDLDTMNEHNGDIKVYNRTKLCNVLFTIELAKRLKDTSVTVYSLHPGVIGTNLSKRFLPEPFGSMWYTFISYFGKSVIEGAQTTIYCSVAKGIEQYSGEQFSDCKKIDRYKNATDPSLPSQLWNKTVKDLKLEKEE